MVCPTEFFYVPVGQGYQLLLINNTIGLTPHGGLILLAKVKDASGKIGIFLSCSIKSVIIFYLCAKFHQDRSKNEEKIMSKTTALYVYDIN